MLPIRYIFLAILAPITGSLASIEYMEQRYFTEESFTRISEYFNGIEDPGHRIILRSEKGRKTGHYVSFEVTKSYPVAHFKLEVFAHGAKEPTDYQFVPDAAIHPAKPIFLGLTGTDWLDKKEPPVAYKLSLVGKDGATLVSQRSFLWGDD